MGSSVGQIQPLAMAVEGTVLAARVGTTPGLCRRPIVFSQITPPSVEPADRVSVGPSPLTLAAAAMRGRSTMTPARCGYRTWFSSRTPPGEARADQRRLRPRQRAARAALPLAAPFIAAPDW